MTAPRLLITRAEPDASETARLVENHGATALLLPTRIAEAVTGDPPAMTPDAVLATSARAFRLGGPIPEDWLALPCLVVGAVTGEAARAAGFRDLRVASGEALSMRPHLAGFSGRRLVYLAGDPRRPELEQDAAFAGVDLVIWPRYRMVEAESLPPEAIEALRHAACDGALHFSRESVESLFRLASAAGLMPALEKIRHACLSPAIEQAVRRHLPGAETVLPARRDAESLIESALASGTIRQAH